MELNIPTLLLALANLVAGLAIGVYLRKRLVEGLLRPVGPLGLVAVAAGAFGALLQRCIDDDTMRSQAWPSTAPRICAQPSGLKASSSCPR